MREIITDPEQLSGWAREVALPKEGAEARQINLELKNIVREKGLTSLSAPAIGIDRRMFVINFNGDIKCFINPVIVSRSGIGLARETCTSIPDKTFIRPRNQEIVVNYMTPLGQIMSQKFLGKAAIVFQHEIDHLEGLLLSDVGLEIDEDFDKASDKEREQVIKAYIDSLDMKEKELNKEIAEDKDLSEMNEAIEFMRAVQKGEVKIEGVPIKRDTEEDNGKT